MSASVGRVAYLDVSAVCTWRGHRWKCTVTSDLTVRRDVAADFSLTTCSWLVLVDLTQAAVIREEEPKLRKCFHQAALQASGGGGGERILDCG